MDITGQRFGRLVALYRIGKNPRGYSLWYFQCDCGSRAFKVLADVRRGKSRSCGCFLRETAAALGRSHLRHGNAGIDRPRLYRIWANMKLRCSNQRDPKFERYGGRGIRVCTRWQRSFETFRDWALSSGYRDDLSIDRINNDHGYRPSNCRWATASQQRRNQRRCAA